MSTSPRFALALATAIGFAAAGGFAISACSSTVTDPGPGVSPDASMGVDSSRPVVDSGVVDEPMDSAVPQTSQQCLDACDKAHAASVAKYNAVDDCWAASCKPSCVDQNGGFDAGDGIDGGFDAGGNANDGGTPLCGTPESSGVSADCDNCTEAYCCPSWIGCYNDADCNALEACYGACP